MDNLIVATAVVAAAPPIVFAVLGETLTERAGVINLSLDGSLLLGAMVGFAAALGTGSVLAGCGAAIATGALVALVLAFVSLTLRQSQVATGFVLTLLCRDLAYVLGGPVARVPGPQVPHVRIPGLADLPVVGRVLFDQDPLVYLSFAAIAAAWAFLYRTHAGLRLRGLGEQPAAAFARGVPVTRLRYLYALAGGGLVGLGGAAFSLLVKPGWARPYGIEGTGWVALAIVIFGGWQPLRAAAAAYLFVALQVLANALQEWLPDVPSMLFPTLPFPLMILGLLLVTVGNAEWTQRALRRLPAGVRRGGMRALTALQAAPPAALGEPFEAERR